METDGLTLTLTGIPLQELTLSRLKKPNTSIKMVTGMEMLQLVLRQMFALKSLEHPVKIGLAAWIAMGMDGPTQVTCYLSTALNTWMRMETGSEIHRLEIHQMAV